MASNQGLCVGVGVGVLKGRVEVEGVVVKEMVFTCVHCVVFTKCSRPSERTTIVSPNAKSLSRSNPQLKNRLIYERESGLFKRSWGHSLIKSKNWKRLTEQKCQRLQLNCKQKRNHIREESSTLLCWPQYNKHIWDSCLSIFVMCNKCNILLWKVKSLQCWSTNRVTHFTDKHFQAQRKNNWLKWTTVVFVWLMHGLLNQYGIVS